MMLVGMMMIKMTMSAVIFLRCDDDEMKSDYDDDDDSSLRDTK